MLKTGCKNYFLHMLKNIRVKNSVYLKILNFLSANNLKINLSLSLMDFYASVMKK